MEERRLDVLFSAVPGLYYATHFIAGSGITLDWMVDNFIKVPGEESKNAFKRADEMAAEASPGCSGKMGI